MADILLLFLLKHSMIYLLEGKISDEIVGKLSFVLSSLIVFYKRTNAWFAQPGFFYCVDCVCIDCVLSHSRILYRRLCNVRYGLLFNRMTFNMRELHNFPYTA